MSFHYWLNSKADEQQKKEWSNKGMDVRIHISYSRVCTHTTKPCIMSCHVPDTCYVQHHTISYHSMSYHIYIYTHRNKQTLLMRWLIYRMRNYQIDIEAIRLKQDNTY